MGFVQTILNKVIGKKGPPDPKQPVEDFVKDVEKEIDEIANRRSGYDQAWFTNQAFILGHHHIVFNTNSRRFDEPQIPDTKRYAVDNQILPRFRQRVAVVLSYDPRAFVTPNPFVKTYFCAFLKVLIYSFKCFFFFLPMAGCFVAISLCEILFIQRQVFYILFIIFRFILNAVQNSALSGFYNLAGIYIYPCYLASD